MGDIWTKELAPVGAHPYADEFPMASDEELDELAQSVATVGLIHPLVVIGTVAGIEDGRLADGRNRRAACEIAGVEPTFEVRNFDTNDELKEFVIGVNTTGRRESMTVQIAAASTALILGEEKRINGQWRRGSVPRVSGESATNFNHRMKECGLVLDVLGRDVLGDVRDGASTLNAAYEFAIQKRDEQRRALEQQDRIATEEADAKAFVEQSAPDLAAKVGDVFESYAEAQAVWEKRNREEATRIATEKRQQAEREKALRDNAENHVRAVAGSLIRLDGMQELAWRERTRDDFTKYADAAPPEQRKLHDPDYLRALAGWITTYANELETA